MKLIEKIEEITNKIEKLEAQKEASKNNEYDLSQINEELVARNGELMLLKEIERKELEQSEKQKQIEKLKIEDIKRETVDKYNKLLTEKPREELQSKIVQLKIQADDNKNNEYELKLINEELIAREKELDDLRNKKSDITYEEIAGENQKEFNELPEEIRNRKIHQALLEAEQEEFLRKTKEEQENVVSEKQKEAEEDAKGIEIPKTTITIDVATKTANVKNARTKTVSPNAFKVNGLYLRKSKSIIESVENRLDRSLTKEEKKAVKKADPAVVQILANENNLEDLTGYLNAISGNEAMPINIVYDASGLENDSLDDTYNANNASGKFDLFKDYKKNVDNIQEDILINAKRHAKVGFSKFIGNFDIMKFSPIRLFKKIRESFNQIKFDDATKLLNEVNEINESPQETKDKFAERLKDYKEKYPNENSIDKEQENQDERKDNQQENDDYIR